MDTIKGFIQEMPEMRFTASGKPITSIRIADIMFEEDAKKFKRIITWEQLAEIVNEELQASDFIYIKGYWKTRSWEGQDGRQHSVNEFTARQIWDKRYKDIMELTNLPVDEE